MSSGDVLEWRRPVLYAYKITADVFVCECRIDNASKVTKVTLTSPLPQPAHRFSFGTQQNGVVQGF